MGEQIHRQPQQTEEAVQEMPTPVDTEAKESQMEEIDRLLDEIDDVIEQNAEDFVSSFVQRGGQ